MGMVCHEGDGFRGNKGGRADQIGFVFAAGIVGHDDKASVIDLGNDLSDGGKLQLAHGEPMMAAIFCRARSVHDVGEGIRFEDTQFDEEMVR
jgi:hypothetical protein